MADSNYDEIRRHVEKRFKERQSLIIHFAIYVILNLLFWMMWAFMTPAVEIASFSGGQPEPLPAAFPWPLIVTLGWGVGMLTHFLTYHYKYGSGAVRREQAIQREVEREIARREADGYLEKPKRDRRIYLSEEGELETAVDIDDDTYDTRKQNGR